MKVSNLNLFRVAFRGVSPVVIRYRTVLRQSSVCLLAVNRVCCALAFAIKFVGVGAQFVSLWSRR